jgi:GDP/UDP-N,N'-diacetylbacillosamine 2-epimerase (hydrolysing)
MRQQLRKILGITGIRSEYDMMSSVFRAIDNHQELELQLLVTGAHLSDNYGYTVSDIYADGFTIADEVESLINGDQASSRVKGMGVQLQGMVQTVSRVQPDMMLVLGDREESITTALIGAYMNIPVAHIGGGERVVGNVDDQVRHAVSKLAHIHLVITHEHEERLLKLGEEPFRMFNVGHPALDRLLATPKLDDATLSERLGFGVAADEPLLVIIQHALSSEIDAAYTQMCATLEAVQELGIATVLSYPNSDAGGQQVIRAIEEYAHLPNLYTAKNIPRLEFVNLLRRASCLLGNSSAGILEAPLLKLPVVNVGRRQTGRLNAGNVNFVDHDRKAIIAAVKQAVYDDAYRTKVATCVNPYGDGHTSTRIADVLATIAIDKQLLIKDITY